MEPSFGSHCPTLGITTGDPAGIGPEVSLRAAQRGAFRGEFRILLFGDAGLLSAQAQQLGPAFDFEVFPAESLQNCDALPMRAVIDVPARRGEIALGRGSAASGDAAARSVIACAKACMAGQVHAMVTAPLNKAFLREAGYPFPGHTEFLAYLSGTTEVAMAFLSERFRVVLATIHLPLRLALEQITPELILSKLRIIVREFPRLGLPCSRLAVAGVNPHAGESGILGAEEGELLVPALVEARNLYPEVRIDGPLPADTIFYRAAQGEFDVVLALFHDQGLAPIKMIGFGEAVNLTLGLPFVRTSVDHGTAFEIAGKGIARPDSMISAIRWALRFTRPRA